MILNSDMYDPFQNAVDPSHRASYYPMVDGSLTGSWLPLRENALDNGPPITVWNWSLADFDPDEVKETVASSYTHFHGLGFAQIVGGFYDVKAPVADEYTEKLFRMAKEYGREISEVCYYTTKRDLSHLESFSELADKVWSPE